MPENEPARPDKNATDTDTQTKRVYQKPILVGLGSLRDVTLSVAQTGNSDGGRTGNRRYTGRGGLDGASPDSNLR